MDDSSVPWFARNPHGCVPIHSNLHLLNLATLKVSMNDPDRRDEGDKSLVTFSP